MLSRLCLTDFTLTFTLQPGVPTFFGFPRHLSGLGDDSPHLFRVHAGNSLQPLFLGSDDLGYGVIAVFDQALRQDISNPFEFLQLFHLFLHGISPDDNSDFANSALQRMLG
jgi:hypothetical protein